MVVTGNLFCALYLEDFKFEILSVSALRLVLPEITIFCDKTSWNFSLQCALLVYLIAFKVSCHCTCDGFTSRVYRSKDFSALFKLKSNYNVKNSDISNSH